jgi:Tol biopolymer transport system component
MRLLALLGVIVLFIVSGCAQADVAHRGPVQSEPVTPEIRPTLATNTPVPPSPSLTPSPSPTITPSATSTSTETPLPTEPHTPTATPLPTETPLPKLRQVTNGGCCVQPFFSPDATQILFIDRPSVNEPVGVYGVDLGNALPATPQLVNEVIGFRSPDRAIVATFNGEMTTLTNEETGETWSVNTGGNRPRFASNNSRIVWVAADREGPYDRRQSDIWVSQLDGSNAGRALSLYGGGFVSWYPDSERVLLVGRERPAEENQNLISVDLTTGEQTNLASQQRIRHIELSPNGSWIVYYVDFSDAAEDRGVWAVSGDGATRKKLNTPGFGAFKWRNDNTLLFIPFRDNPADSMELWAIELSTNKATPVTIDPPVEFSISNGDWVVSPDGNKIVFVNSSDQNIWLITLPAMK